MKHSKLFRTTISKVLIVSTLFPAFVFADPPSWAGGGKDKKEQRSERKYKDDHRENNTSGGRVSVNAYFGDQQRIVIHDYYAEQFRKGHCPPGLAKKNNGCLPPGQAKKWRVGYPLPSDVRYYDLPPSVVIKLGTPPAGHKFVRVASDILLMAVGTSMVVDAIEDLGNL